MVLLMTRRMIEKEQFGDIFFEDPNKPKPRDLAWIGRNISEGLFIYCEQIQFFGELCWLTCGDRYTSSSMFGDELLNGITDNLYDDFFAQIDEAFEDCQGAKEKPQPKPDNGGGDSKSKLEKDLFRLEKKIFDALNERHHLKKNLEDQIYNALGDFEEANDIEIDIEDLARGEQC